MSALVYLPALQLSHFSTLAAEYVPAPQSVQTRDPAAEYLPAPQTVHVALLTVGLNLPASQAVQFPPPVPMYPGLHTQLLSAVDENGLV